MNECLKAGGKLIYSAHATHDRLRQRGLSPSDVDAILRDGFAYRVDPGMASGEWKVNLSKRMPCGRDAAVVCLVSKSVRNVTVLTVMWVDRSYLKA